MPSRTIVPPHPVDFRLTLGPTRRGRYDPCTRIDASSVGRATNTPDGPATLHLAAAGTRIEAEAWGPGAGWALDQAPELLGCHDDRAGFEAHHPVVADLARRLAGLRLGRTGAVMEALVASILEQKVTGMEARRSWAQLAARYGEPAPGPGGLVVPPAAEVLAGLPYHEFHPLGVERKRADTVRRACARARGLEEAVRMSPVAARERLTTVAGVGVWTAAEVALVALGDPDAVSVGDFHLPHQVSWVLAGEPRGDDARMLELLEPYRGHRGRVIRLIGASGLRPPRRGPRMPARSIARL